MTNLLPASSAGGPDGVPPSPGAAALLRFTWTLLLLASAGLLAASVYRAATFPFTHDESLSFAGFTWNPRWGKTANNHLLNTWLMQLCSTLFGNSELSLRLPNLLAHAAYLAGSLRLLGRFQPAVLRLAGFVLLNLNPFALDFFFLARGYGLAMAFVMWSLYLLLRACEARQQSGFKAYLVLSQLTALLAVLANFAFLNYYLPLMLASAWLLLSDESLRRFDRSALRTAVALFAVHGVCLAGVASRLLQLRQEGGLYFGGKVGFINDTVGSLVRVSLYTSGWPDETVRAVSAMVIGLFVILLGVCSYLFYSRMCPPLFAPFMVIAVGAVVLPLLQHWLFQTPFPLERSGLYYLPVCAVFALSAFHSLAGLPGWRRSRAAILTPPVVCAAILALNFFHSFNTGACYTWGYDAHTNEALRIIDRDRKEYFGGKRVVRLYVPWWFGPSLNYYHVTRGYAWLETVHRMIQIESIQYIYAPQDDFKEFLKGGYARLASFPDTGTVLLRVNHANGPGPSTLIP